MKIERMLCGMQTTDGRILIKYSNEAKVQALLTPKSRDKIKSLRPVDSGKPLWFPTEQTIAYPVIIEVKDKHPKHGGRTWWQNQTFLVNIHDYLAYTLGNGTPFEQFILPELDTFPTVLETINL